MNQKSLNLQRIFLIILTLFFFSTSSILCRLALVEESIDAYSFTFFRLLFGALVLLSILYIKEKSLSIDFKNNWLSAFMLFLYALCFSFSYVNLDAGLGALILFAVVQLTIIVSAFFYKEALSIQKLLGIAIAFMGLIFLLYPNDTFQVSLFHIFLMIISGIAWGLYTILGKKSSNALTHTADNFLKSLLFIMPCYFILSDNSFITLNGLILAFLSGGITSALGYSLWYYIVPQIQITTSGVLQLIVPVIAIFLGIIFLQEVLTVTLAISTLVILVGITICIYSKN